MPDGAASIDAIFFFAMLSCRFADSRLIIAAAAEMVISLLIRAAVIFAALPLRLVTLVLPPLLLCRLPRARCFHRRYDVYDAAATFYAVIALARYCRHAADGAI